MQLVESYLVEVGRFLPQDQRLEILSELRDAIVGEVEGSVEPAGREPSLEEEKNVLARFGHPLKVASHYQPEKYLIGPDLYPAFMQTLKVVFAVAVFAQVVVALIVAQTNDWQLGPFALLGALVDMAVWVVAIVVLVFIAIENSGERLHWYENWRPESISPGGLCVIKRGDVITNLVSEGFFLLWWNNVVVLQNWLPDQPEDFYISLSQVWTPYFWPLNILFAVMFLSHLYVLVCGVWQRRTLIVEIVGNTALLGAIAVLLSAGVLLEVRGLQNEQVLAIIQQSVKISLLVIAGFTIWDMWIAFKGLRGTTLLESLR